MNKSQNSPHYEVGPWTFNPDKNELEKPDGHVSRLEEKISLLLLTLCERRGEIVSKEALINEVWQGRELSEQTIPVAISKLRKALGDDINYPTMLATIPRQGYQLLSAAPDHSTEDTNRPNTVAWAFAALLLAVGMTTWMFMAPADAPPERVQVLNTEKPGVIVTINDVRTLEGTEEENRLAIAISELSAYYLSQISDLLVIRHWWNLDAPDPTGGIYTRYGQATPVYSLKGTLLNESDNRIVTFILSDPQTDEVIWSGIHPIESGSTSLFPMFETMLGQLPVRGYYARNRAPEESVGFWRARYFMELSNPGAAQVAAEELSQLMASGVPSPSVASSIAALKARWSDEQSVASVLPDISKLETELETSSTSTLTLVDQATIELFGNQNTEAALELLRQALENSPGDHYAHSLRGEALYLAGEKDAALQAFRLANRLAPYARVYADRIASLE